MQPYNPFLVYCRELALGTVSLTGDWAQGDDSIIIRTIPFSIYFSRAIPSKKYWLLSMCLEGLSYKLHAKLVYIYIIAQLHTCLTYS